LLTGSAHALSQADDKTPINDSWLTSKTKIALFADARVKGGEINVETTQGYASGCHTIIYREVDETFYMVKD
jgi:osmotically-inducible protein OsmY